MKVYHLRTPMGFDFFCFRDGVLSGGGGFSNSSTSAYAERAISDPENILGWKLQGSYEMDDASAREICAKGYRLMEIEKGPDYPTDVLAEMRACRIELASIADNLKREFLHTESVAA